MKIDGHGEIDIKYSFCTLDGEVAVERLLSITNASHEISLDVKNCLEILLSPT